MSTRHKSWHFATILTVTPDVTHSITRDPHSSADVIKRVLTSQILSRADGSRPDAIFNVELRYKLSDLNASCSILPVEGYIQSKIPLAEYIMQRWFQAHWSPVGGHCSRNPEYKAFCAPDPNYIRLALCEKVPPNKGGRLSKKKEAHGVRPRACDSGRSSPESSATVRLLIIYGNTYFLVWLTCILYFPCFIILYFPCFINFYLVRFK